MYLCIIVYIDQLILRPKQDLQSIYKKKFEPRHQKVNTALQHKSLPFFISFNKIRMMTLEIFKCSIIFFSSVISKSVFIRHNLFQQEVLELKSPQKLQIPHSKTALIKIGITRNENSLKKGKHDRRLIVFYSPQFQLRFYYKEPFLILF